MSFSAMTPAQVQWQNSVEDAKARRERIATAVLAGMSANAHDYFINAKAEILASWAIFQADALIAALDEDTAKELPA